MMFKTNSKNNYIKENDKIPLKFDISMLNMFIGYLFKRSVQITRRSLNNMKKLMDIIDESIYDGNENMSGRFEFIKKALEAKLDRGFENDEMVINYCRSDIGDSINKEIIDNIPIYAKINYEEIKYINKAVEDRLQFFYIFYFKDKIYNAVEKIDSGNYKSLFEVNSEVVDLCTSLLNRVRQANSVEESDTFSLSDENFESNIIDIAEKLKNPSSILKTGIQKLNELLAPGLMSGRLYMFMGLPG